jgi:DNA-directed RNA polymerase specialized sigma24 family protein
MPARTHDLLFQVAFESPEHAAALLREIVPAALSALITWDTLRCETSSFVDPALTYRHSDLVFSAQLRNGPSRIFLTLEHQSTGDRAMPLRTLAYQVRIWNRFRKAYPTAPLPPIVVVLVSHVRGGWTRARSLGELFDALVPATPALAQLLPNVPLIVEDLAHRSNDDLQRRTLPAFPKLALWLLRDARDRRRLLDNFDAWVNTFEEAERGPDGRDAITALLTYLFRVIDPKHHDELRAKLRQLGSHTEEITMSIIDMWVEQGREQGRKQGVEQGREQGRVAALRRLVLLKFDCEALDDRFESALRRASPEAVDGYLQRVLTAASVAAVFED